MASSGFGPRPGADNFRISYIAREPRGTARESPPRRAAGPPAADQRGAARRRARAPARERAQARPDRWSTPASSPRSRSPTRWRGSCRFPTSISSTTTSSPKWRRRCPKRRRGASARIVLEDSAAALQVGLADPTDLIAYDEIARILKREIELAVVTEIAAAGQPSTASIAAPARSAASRRSSRRNWAMARVDFGALAATPRTRGSAGRQAAADRCSRTRLRCAHPTSTSSRRKRSCVIRFRIDGVLHLQTEADPKIASALVLRLKLMSGLDISEKRLPQDGRFNVKIRSNAGRRADLHHADPVRRIGGDAPAQSGSGLLSARPLGMPPRMLGACPRRAAPRRAA